MTDEYAFRARIDAPYAAALARDRLRRVAEAIQD